MRLLRRRVVHDNFLEEFPTNHRGPVRIIQRRLSCASRRYQDTAAVFRSRNRKSSQNPMMSGGMAASVIAGFLSRARSAFKTRAAASDKWAICCRSKSPLEHSPRRRCIGSATSRSSASAAGRKGGFRRSARGRFCLSGGWVRRASHRRASFVLWSCSI
jgi:hypothetical protein